VLDGVRHFEAPLLVAESGVIHRSVGVLRAKHALDVLLLVLLRELELVQGLAIIGQLLRCNDLLWFWLLLPLVSPL